MAKAIAVKTENTSIEEIAERILNEEGYNEKLLHGIATVSVDISDVKERGRVYVSAASYDTTSLPSKMYVYKGSLIGYLGYTYCRSFFSVCEIIAPTEGLFIPRGKFGDYRDLQKSRENIVIIGAIYPSEYEFYKSHQNEIAAYIELKKKELALREKQQKDDEARKAAALLDEQRQSIDDIGNMFAMLDVVIEKKEQINITTLKGIEDALLVLVRQKDNIKDIKSIELYKAHFENAYKEYVNISGGSNPAVKRMIKILDLFYDVLGKSAEEMVTLHSKWEQMSAEVSKKWQEELSGHLQKIDDAVIQVQSSIINKESININQLKKLEEILFYLSQNTDRVNDKHVITRSKENMEAVFTEYIKLENKDSSIENELKRILLNFHKIFGESDQGVKEFFAKLEERELDRRFEIEFAENIKKINDAIISLQNSVWNKSAVDFSQFQIIEDILSVLLHKKDGIKNMEAIQSAETKVEAIYEEFAKDEDSSENSIKTMRCVLNKFYELLGESDQRVKEFFAKLEERELDRRFEIEFAENIKKINDAIISLQNSVWNKSAVDFSQFQIIEDILSVLLHKKDGIKNMETIQSAETKVEAIYEEFAKDENSSENSIKAMRCVLNKFYELLGVSTNQIQKIQEARKKTDEEREFARQIAEQNRLCEAISNSIQQLQGSLENGEKINVETLRTIEGALTALENQGIDIQDIGSIEKNRKYFEALFKDCKRQKGFLKSTGIRMQEIIKQFSLLVKKVSKKK